MERGVIYRYNFPSVTQSDALTWISAGMKTDLLTLEASLSLPLRELLLDARCLCLQGQVVHHRVGLLPQKQLFSKHNWS